MGPQSQMSPGTVKKSKKYAISRRAKVMRNNIRNQPVRNNIRNQSVLNFAVKPKPSNNNNTVAPVAAIAAAPVAAASVQLPVCTKCFRESLGKFNKKKHDDHCPKRVFRKQKQHNEHGLRKSKETIRVEAVAEANIKKNNVPLKETEKASGAVSRADWEKFNAPRTNAPRTIGRDASTIARETETKRVPVLPTKATQRAVSRAVGDEFMKQQPVVPVPAIGKIMTKEALSSTAFTSAINDRMKDPTNRMKIADRKEKPVLPQVVAVIDYLMTMLPAKCKATTAKPTKKNRNRHRISMKQKKLDAYREFFPPGTLGIKLPPSDRSKPPDLNYNVVEGITVYIVRWEMNIPNQKVRCPCCNREMKSDKYDITKYGGITPVQDISGVTNYAISM